MSGLAAVLAGRQDPGVFVWHAAFEPDEVRHAVEGAGRRFAYVDGWRAQTGHELLVALGEALAFPDYYGSNLDAFADCLGDLVGQVVLLWDGWGTVARSDARTFRIVVELLGEHAPVVTTLLRGEGPDISLPSLD